MIFALILGVILLGALLWWLLDRHEKRRVVAGKPRHSALRLIFGAAALLVVLFSGGCGSLFLANADGQYVTWEAVAIIAGPPFAIGLAGSWLALRRHSGFAQTIVATVLVFLSVLYVELVVGLSVFGYGVGLGSELEALVTAVCIAAIFASMVFFGLWLTERRKVEGS